MRRPWSSTPAGCTGPAHPLWLGDADDSRLLSWFGGDAIAVITPGIPAP